MIILKDIFFEHYQQQSVEVELPRANMVIDPRPIDVFSTEFLVYPLQCEYHDNGTTVTLTRSDNGICIPKYSFRVYDPATETVPSFDSTIYTYLGEEGERAPIGTTVLIIHPSVTVIKENAFSYCKKMKKCFMHDGVHTIERGAFYDCKAMKVIRLSRSLTHIGAWAFRECWSLEAVFLPPSVNQIDEHAFEWCRNLRIFPLPLNIDISQIGKWMLVGSDIFFQTTQIQEYADDEDDEDEDEVQYDNNRVHEDIIHFYRHQVPPLHRACLHTHVTHQTIRQCINTHGRAIVSITDHDGMTPLHILAMNPHADISALLACFDLDMGIAFVGDSRGNTPLDYLRVHRDSIDDHTLLVSSLCMHRYAAASALSQDHHETSTNSNKQKKRKRANDK